MGKFAYSARTQDGKLIRGEVQAEEAKEAKKKVFELQLIPLEVNPISKDDPQSPDETSKRPWQRFSFRAKVSVDDQMLFFQQLQTIYSVGVPLLKGLSLIQEQCENPHLKAALGQALVDIADGRSISESFSKFPDIFDEVTVNLIRAGEATGQLDKILDRIAKLLQQRIQQKAKISSATFYPKIVLTMIFVVILVVMYFVIPKFEDFFSRFGGNLPLLTKIMLGCSKFLTSYWYLIAALVVGAIFGYLKFKSTPEGKQKLDEIFLRMPIFGTIFLQNDMLSFCSVFEMMIRSGVPIVQAIPIVRGAIANVLIQKEIEGLKKKIEAGQSLSQSLAGAKYFPPTMPNVIGIGEEAGSLEKVFERLASFYQIQLDRRLETLSKSIEPILLVIIFGIVLLLALSVFLPLWKMNSLIKK